MQPWEVLQGEQIRTMFEKSNKLLLFQHKGLRRHEWRDLVYDLRQEAMIVTLFQNRLIRHFMKDTKYVNFLEYVEHHNSIMVNKTDSDVNLKAVLKRIRYDSRLELKGGIIDNNIMTYDEIVAYSNLPTLEQSRSELVQLLSQPSSTLSRLLQTNQSNLSQNLSLYVDQKNEAAA